MSTITQDEIRPEDLEGLKKSGHLLTVINQLQGEAAGALNGGLMLSNFWRVVLTGVEVVTPEEWAPLAPLNGFADAAGGGAGAFAARKDPLTNRVELREVVNRPAGAPAATTVIARLPAGYGPLTYVVRVSECDSGHGAYDVVPATSATPAQIRYQKGTPTAAFWLNGGSWQAADPSIPPWSKPVTLLVRNPFGARVVRHVLCEARTADGGASAILSTVRFPGAFLQPPADVDGQWNLVLPRIDGLRPLMRYSLTIWAFLE
jgi:hypothetical protein